MNTDTPLAAYESLDPLEELFAAQMQYDLPPDWQDKRRLAHAAGYRVELAGSQGYGIMHDGKPATNSRYMFAGDAWVRAAILAKHNRRADESGMPI